MPNIILRLQNTSGHTITFVSSSQSHMNWHQSPPISIANTASSGNIQLSYSEDALPASFTVNYSLPGVDTNFTATGDVEEDGSLSWSGAAPGGYITHGVTSTDSIPNFLFTFSVEG